MIPKIIHYCWFGRNPKPKLAEKCIKSWKKYCPDYQIIEWNEDNYDVTKLPYMKAAHDAGKWAFVTDYARLDLVHTHGGIYLDTDVELVKPIDALLNYTGYAGFESDEYVATGLGFGAEAGSQIIRKLMESYTKPSADYTDGKVELVTCPKLDTAVLCGMGLRRDGSFQKIDNFAFFPADYFNPKDYGNGLIKKTEHTYSIHHHAASWIPAQDIEKRNAWWRQQRREHIRYAPNRFVRKLFGDDKVDRLKRFLGK